MKNKLNKFTLIVVNNCITLPLAYLSASHGSSFGLESSVTLTVLCIIINITIIKAK